MALWMYQGTLLVAYNVNAGTTSPARRGDLEAVLRTLQLGQHGFVECQTDVQTTDSPDGVHRTYQLELTIQVDSDLSGFPTDWKWGDFYGIQRQLGERATFVQTKPRQKLSDPDDHPWQ